MTDFTRKTRSTSPKLAVENDRAANAVADHHVKQVASATTGADFELAISRGVCVVLKLNPQTRRARKFAMKIAENC